MIFPGYQLAQVNIARLLAPLESPRLAGFVSRLDEINQLADSNPGFVWRMGDDSGNNTSYRPFDDDILVNLSVWTDAQSLFDYVYRSTHKELFALRRHWFESPEGAHMALWWVPEGHRPTAEEAKQRLEHRTRHGDTPYAFSFKKWFTPDGQQSATDAVAAPAGEPDPEPA